MTEPFEQIITIDDKPVLRIAYPIEFKEREFLVIQKKHFKDKKTGELLWRGGLWINIADEADIQDVIEPMIEAIYNILAAGGWELDIEED